MFAKQVNTAIPLCQGRKVAPRYHTRKDCIRLFRCVLGNSMILQGAFLEKLLRTNRAFERQGITVLLQMVKHRIHIFRRIGTPLLRTYIVAGFILDVMISAHRDTWSIGRPRKHQFFPPSPWRKKVMIDSQALCMAYQ